MKRPKSSPAPSEAALDAPLAKLLARHNCASQHAITASILLSTSKLMQEFLFPTTTNDGAAEDICDILLRYVLRLPDDNSNVATTKQSDGEGPADSPGILSPLVPGPSFRPLSVLLTPVLAMRLLQSFAKSMPHSVDVRHAAHDVYSQLLLKSYQCLAHSASRDHHAMTLESLPFLLRGGAQPERDGDGAPSALLLTPSVLRDRAAITTVLTCVPLTTVTVSNLHLVLHGALVCAAHMMSNIGAIASKRNNNASLSMDSESLILMCRSYLVLFRDSSFVLIARATPSVTACVASLCCTMYQLLRVAAGGANDVVWGEWRECVAFWTEELFSRGGHDVACSALCALAGL